MEQSLEVSVPEQSGVIVDDLPPEAQLKLKVIQSLLEPCDRREYGLRLREGAEKLGLSVRSVQRLFRRYQKEGISCLTSSQRPDKGQHRIGSDWKKFIEKTYKDGNSGSRRMNPKQVHLRVLAKARQENRDNPLAIARYSGC